MKTKDQTREKRRPFRPYYYTIDPDSKEVQMTFGKPKPKPKAVVYLPHYEKSLRIEIPLPEGDPSEVQEKLDDYKEKFINWFGGDKKKGFNWGNKTRRWAWGQVALKIQGIKLDREESRALRTLFMYRGVLKEFDKGKQRKDVVEKISKQRDFQFEQVRKAGRYSRKTGVVLKTQRRKATINRDLSSLVKIGILRKVGRGRYEVDRDKELELANIDRAVIHEK
jgi:hypothetical protein